MTDNPAGFTGSIPEHYDQGLGPVIFVDYAAEMADRVAAFARGAVHGNPLGDQVRARGGVDPETIVGAILEEFRREFGDPGRMPLQAIMFSARKPRAV